MCGFRKGKSLIYQLLIIEQLMDRKLEFRSNEWKVFMDFKKAFDSIRRDSLLSTMYEFGFSYLSY